MKPEKVIAVIDLKAFYSFVECVDRGLDAWKVPLVVADKERGKNTIVLSVSPYLKQRGVPSRLRIKELPKGYDYIYAVPRMERYIEKSSEVMSTLMQFVSPEDVHVYSIDEAFMDLSSYLKYYKKTPMQMVETIIESIKEQTGLQATGGIGDNFFLAKVALDLYAKHEKNGIAIMREEDIPTKLWNVTPLSKIWGIGQGTEAKLNKLGMYSVYDLAHANRDFMISKFGIMGEQLLDLANGKDESDIHDVYVPKSSSLSIGQVLFKDYTVNEAKLIIREMVDDLSLRMRNEKKTTDVVHLYIGYSKMMGGFSAQMSLLHPTDDTDLLYEAALEIYKKHVQDKPIRNIGINFGHLDIREFQQLDLFTDPQKSKNSRDLQLTMDALKNKYGKNIVLRASSLLEESTIIERHNQIGGHRK